MNSQVNESDKDQILSSLLYADHDYPNHESIKDYNLGIKQIKPDSAIEKSSKQIKNAWFSFLAVMPSVIQDQILYVPSQITAQTEFSYNIEIPENYRARKYPRTKGGDRKTDYSLSKNRSEVHIFVNDQRAGTGKITNVQIR